MYSEIILETDKSNTDDITPISILTIISSLNRTSNKLCLK